MLVSGGITKVFQKVVEPYKENCFQWSSSNEKDDREKAFVVLSKAMSSEPLHQDLVGENITVNVSARGPWGGGFCTSRGRTRSRWFSHVLKKKGSYHIYSRLVSTRTKHQGPISFPSFAKVFILPNVQGRVVRTRSWHIFSLRWLNCLLPNMTFI